MRTEYMHILRSIVNNYQAYVEIAVSLQWQKAKTTYYDASQYGSEVHLAFCTVAFPKGYLQTHFAEAFVQTMFTMMAYSEEWEPDNWAHIPLAERRKHLTQGEALYRTYLCFERLTMQEMDAAEMQSNVHSWFPWAKTEKDSQSPYALLLPDKAKELFSRFSQAEAVLLGGMGGCTPDENWLAIQEDSFLFVSFHCSG